MNSHANRFSRRRFIAIAASSAAITALPFTSMATTIEPLYRWNGVAMGAAASLQFHGKTAAESKVLCSLCLNEIVRLERIFSLYEPQSALNQLNRHGVLENAPKELIELVTLSKKFGDVTDGMFDVTIQPVWQARKQDESADKIEQALKLVDYRNITIEAHHIRFAKKGMAVTFNGIAQGYITDKVTQLLKENGLQNVLVNMGEFHALGNKPDGSAWKVGIRSAQDPHILDAVELNNSAMATSAGYGTALGKSHHLLNPKTGNASHYHRSLSLVASDATTADALSTGLYHMPAQQAHRVINRMNGLRPLKLFIQA